jgi:tripeptide aminopeptidase
MKNAPYSVEERFVRYAQIDTTADPNATSFPSSEKQKDLSKVLVDELLALGIEDAEMDQWGYVFATIPATSTKESIPTICFCSHMDTAPDCSGTNVKPIVHHAYSGAPIVLPDDPSQVITVEKHPYLKERIGDDIITASGTTLLGADDKAGVAIIMDLAAQLMANPSIPHGKIRILFTPDEEVGRGVEQLDMEKLNADFGYTRRIVFCRCDVVSHYRCERTSRLCKRENGSCGKSCECLCSSTSFKRMVSRSNNRP